MKHYVYKISNIIEDKHYIGVRSAKNPNKDLGIKYFSSSSDEEFMLEQQEFPERFEYNILEVFSTRKLAVAKEIELHNLYDVAVNESFYNRAKQTSSGFCTLGTQFSEESKRKMRETRKTRGITGLGSENPFYGKTHTDESKEKISLAHMGKTHSEETKEKMSLDRTGGKHPLWGKSHTVETKEKMRSVKLGKIVSNETKVKMSLSRIGKTHSEETKEKISLAQIGKILSEETKEKISLAHIGKTASNETREKMSLTKQKLDQKNAFRFIIHNSDGDLIHDEVIVSFAMFCSENKYTLCSFQKSFRTNEPIPRGRFKGWTVERITN